MKRSGVVCPSVLICEEPTTRIGAFLKSCQMREKSSVSPNLIGEKSHDFAAGGFWLLARRLESTVIHSHYKPQTEQSQAMHGMGGAMHTHTRVATRVHFRKWSQIGGNAIHQNGNAVDSRLNSYVSPPPPCARDCFCSVRNRE